MLFLYALPQLASAGDPTNTDQSVISKIRNSFILDDLNQGQFLHCSHILVSDAGALVADNLEFDFELFPVEPVLLGVLFLPVTSSDEKRLSLFSIDH